MNYPMTIDSGFQNSENTSKESGNRDAKKKSFSNKISTYTKKVLDSLKARVDKFENMLKEFIQKINSFITKKLAKLFKQDTIMVAQRFYNNVMNLIHEIESIAPNPIQKFKLDATLFTGNQEYVRKVYDELEYQYTQLNARAKNISELKPEKGDKIIVIRTDKLKKMQNEFITIRNNSMAYIKLLQQGAITISQKTDIPLNNVTPAISSLCRAASLTMFKGSTLVSLIDKLLRSGYHSKEEMEKDEHAKTRAYATESMIEFCDRMMITEESMRSKEINQISKDSSKDVEDYDKEIFGMPESNEKEIKEKLKKIKEIRDLIGDYIDKLKDMKPDAFDRLIGAIGRIGNIALTAGTVYYSTRNTMTKNLGVKTKSSYAKSFIAILGLRILNNATFKKACVSNKKKARDILIQELKTKDKRYAALEKGLKTRLS